MATDRLGNKLEVGDGVLIEGRIAAFRKSDGGVTGITEDAEEIIVDPVFADRAIPETKRPITIRASVSERSVCIAELSGEAEDNQADGVKVGQIQGEIACTCGPNEECSNCPPKYNGEVIEGSAGICVK